MPEPYLLPTHDTFVEWGNDVKAAGGVLTVIPKGLARGAYAARFPNVDGLPPSSYVYVPAPRAVLLWQFGQTVSGQIDQFEADIVDWIESVGSTSVQTIADAVQLIGEAGGQVVASTLAGWWWVLLPAAALAAYLYLPAPRPRRRR